MQKLVIIFLFLSLYTKAQDKLFFTDGTVQKGILMSVTKDIIYFKATDTSEVQAIRKSNLLLAEDYKGVRYVFSKQPTVKESIVSEKKALKRNSIGTQPFGIFTGRATLAYERFTADDRIGFVIPVSLTFDPIGVLYNSQIDSSANSSKRITGVNFITGMDVNFYLGRDNGIKFYLGPRFRYGTDLFLRGIEAYSFQTQFGLRLGESTGGFVQHISIGFGFVRILESPSGSLINPKQSYAWYSINYRLGIRW